MTESYCTTISELTNCSLNVARLANIPESVVGVAAVKSRELETEARRRKLTNLYGQIHLYEIYKLTTCRSLDLSSVLGELNADILERSVTLMEQL